MHLTFLICSERSGSNLITRMIDAHSLYCGPSPLHAFRILSRALSSYGDLSQDENWSQLLGDCADLVQAQIGLWHTQWSKQRLRAEVSKRTLAAILRHIYGTEAAAHGKTRVLVKEIGVHRFLPYLLSAFPEARFVYVVRDPRDMALSWKRSPTHRGGVLRAATIWQEEQAAGLDILAWLGEVGIIHCVRYEGLVHHPRETLDGVCHFLGIEFEGAMLDFHRDDLTRGNAGRTHNWRNLSSPVLKGNTGKFRIGLSDDEIRYVEGACGPQMEAFGYAPEVDPAPDLDALGAKLAASEPVNKPHYVALDEGEKRRRAQWSAVVSRILGRGPEIAGSAQR